MAKGIYRVKDGWATEDSVLVRYDDGKELEISAHQYQLDGYAPHFDQLPWKPE